MRALVAEHNMTAEIDSCGTHGYHIGEQPDPRTMEVAGHNGVDMTFLSARKLQPADFEDFDHLIAMDQGHLRIMRSLAPAEHADKISLFLDYLPGHEGQDVPDPYYGGAQGFADVFDLITRGCQSILDDLLVNT